MTNTKPTWEDEWKEKFWKESVQGFSNFIREPHFYGKLEESLAFIKKVEEEAYERGKKDGVIEGDFNHKLNVSAYKYIKKNFGDVIKKLSEED